MHHLNRRSQAKWVLYKYLGKINKRLLALLGSPMVSDLLPSFTFSTFNIQSIRHTYRDSYLISH